MADNDDEKDDLEEQEEQERILTPEWLDKRFKEWETSIQTKIDQIVSTKQTNNQEMDQQIDYERLVKTLLQNINPLQQNNQPPSNSQTNKDQQNQKEEVDQEEVKTKQKIVSPLIRRKQRK